MPHAPAEPDLHAHTPLKQVHGNDEHRSSLVPRLDEALEAGEGTGDHAHPIADPDPRHGTGPLDVGHHAADGLDLPLRNRVEGVPPLPEDADDALRARDADVSLAARRKAEKEIAGEQRALENDTAVAPPARDPCARKEDLETLPRERLLYFALALAHGPNGEPRLTTTRRNQDGSRALATHGSTLPSSDSLGGSAVPTKSPARVDSRFASTSVTPS